MGWFSKLESGVSNSFSKFGNEISHGVKYIGHEIEDHPIESAVIGVTAAAALIAAPFTGGASLAAEGELVAAETTGGALAAGLADVDATLAVGAEASDAVEVGEAGLEDMDAMEARFEAMEDSGQVRTVDAEEEFFDVEEDPADVFQDPAGEQPFGDKINQVIEERVIPNIPTSSEEVGQMGLNAVRGTARLATQGVQEYGGSVARAARAAYGAVEDGAVDAGINRTAFRAGSILSTSSGRALAGTAAAATASAIGFGTKVAIDETNKNSTDDKLKTIQEELQKIEIKKKKKKKSPTFASKL